MGFATSKSDFSLFIRKGRLGPVSILLYVDDLVITGADLGELDRVKLQKCSTVQSARELLIKIVVQSAHMHQYYSHSCVATKYYTCTCIRTNYVCSHVN